MAARSDDPMSQRALCLLSLDGGGIRGISELIILEEIMYRVKRAQKLNHDPLPADYFDLICGTSTGGLIALLLGRLRFSVPEAIEQYRVLAKEVFSDKKQPGKDGTFKASKLENAVKDTVATKLGNGYAGEKMFVPDEGAGHCKTFVCAVAAQHVDRRPRLFRTWSAEKNPGYNCAIWEAARATSAAPLFFKRILIGEPGMQEEFVDAALGCNNPLRELVSEATNEFGEARHVGCIVSIGTGTQKVPKYDRPTLPLQRFIPADLIEVLKQLATDSEGVATDFKEKYRNCPGLFHRLNVGRGLENVSLEEWDKLGEVKTHTMAYLREPDISREVDAVVEALIRKSHATFTLGPLDGLVPAATSTTYYHYPTQRVSHFVTRDPLFQEVRRFHHSSTRSVSAQVVVLLGMGGCGKTQLALDYCEQAQRGGHYKAVFWVDASSPATVMQSYTVIAKTITKIKPDTTDAEASVRAVVSTVSSWGFPWLFVFDNFDDPKAFKQKGLNEYFPRGQDGSILITSRHAGSKSMGPSVTVSDMSDEEGLELLLRRTRYERNETSCREGAKIIERLGNLALAIDQAGAYIVVRSLELSSFLDHYNTRRARVLDETPDVWEYRRKINPTEVEKSLSAFTTWELSFELITGDNETRKSKEHLLYLAAFLDSKSISEELFRTYDTESEPGWMDIFIHEDSWDPKLFLDVVAELRNLSLIHSLDSQPENTIFSLHPLIHDCMKLKLVTPKHQDYTLEAVQMLSAYLSSQDTQRMSLRIKQTTLSHLEITLGNQAEFLSQTTHWGEHPLRSHVPTLADFFEDQGKFAKAELLLKQSLEGDEKRLGFDHPVTIKTLRDLARNIYHQGRHREVEELCNRVIPSAREKAPQGSRSLAELNLMDTLAFSFNAQKQFDKALPLREQVHRAYEQKLGRDHPDTLAALAKLAKNLEDLNRHSEAEALLERILVGLEEHHGPEHLAKHFEISKVATTFQDQEQHAEAGSLFKRALARREKQLGTEHPETPRVLCHLADVFMAQQQYSQAETLYEQALAGYKKQLGPEHPETLHALTNLGLSYYAQQQYSQAETLYEQALAGSEKQLGPEHPDTLETLRQLACTYEAQEQYPQAKALFEQVLEVQERQLGPEHLETLHALTNLGLSYCAQQQYSQAETLYEQALAGLEKQLGPEHPDTLETLCQLACTYEAQEQYPQAEALFERVLEVQERQLGPEHPDTLRTLCLLAYTYEDQEQHPQAKALLERALAGQERQLGFDHSDTLDTREELRFVQQRMESRLSRSNDWKVRLPWRRRQGKRKGKE